MRNIYKVENKSKINNITELRIKKGLSVKELSELTKFCECEVGYETIKSYETDRLDLRKANSGIILSLCNVLKVTPVKLFKNDYGEKLLSICRKTYLYKIK